MINSFQGEYRFLSNFWGVQVTFEGLSYPSTEHAYQAAKTTSKAQREVIRSLPTPGMAKRAGKAVSLRPDWDEVKLEVMTRLIVDKFDVDHPAQLWRRLEATGDAELVEGNTWGDTFWGICRGQGHNHLGKLLMQQRAYNRQS